jgi:hypothetical protein
MRWLAFFVLRLLLLMPSKQLAYLDRREQERGRNFVTLLGNRVKAGVIRQNSSGGDDRC